MKKGLTSSTHKKVRVLLFKGAPVQGYASPSALPGSAELDVLTSDGEHRPIPIESVKAVHFVRDFEGEPGLVRKSFLSRPKLDGLWVRLRFRDDDTLEGIIPNDLLGLIDGGIQMTPPDLHGNVVRVFVPRTALAEMTVLGVVGAARRGPRPLAEQIAADQKKLFD